MNRKQLITMWAGIGVVILITLFPPTRISTITDEFKAYDFLSIEGLEAQ